MTLAIKVLGIGLAGVATVGAGTASYLLLSPSTINLKETEDYQKYCYKLTEFTKDNSDGSKFQLLACQTNWKTDDVSFYLYQKESTGDSSSKGSFEEVKSVNAGTSSSEVTVNLFNNQATNNGSKLNIFGSDGWKPNSKLNNSVLKDICKVNWSGGNWERKLTCQVTGENLEHDISKNKQFNTK